MPAATSVVPLESMTSRQLIRRATLVEAVTELIGDVGHEAVQMRDVAQRSGVALATAYRYFRSKEHLLAVALEEWQRRLVRRTMAASENARPGSESAILEYLRRAQRAFSRHPEMTALMLQMMTAKDVDVSATIDRMNRANAEMFELLLQGFPADVEPALNFALNALLTSAVTHLLVGGMSLEESQARVEWSAKALLSRAAAQR